MELRFPISRPDGVPVLEEPEIEVYMEDFEQRGRFVYNYGHGDCLTKKLEERLDPDLPDDVVLAGVDQIFEAAQSENSQCAVDVGGPVDVAAIDANGFRWLRRKPEPVRPVREEPAVAPEDHRGNWERFRNWWASPV